MSMPTKFKPFLNKDCYILIPPKDQGLWGWQGDVPLKIIEWTPELKELLIEYYEDYLIEISVVKDEKWMLPNIICIGLLGSDADIDDLEELFNESSAFLFVDTSLGDKSPVICTQSDDWNFNNFVAKTCNDMIPIHLGKSPSWE